MDTQIQGAAGRNIVQRPETGDLQKLALPCLHLLIVFCLPGHQKLDVV